MTTSSASFSWARAAIRRACSSESRATSASFVGVARQCSHRLRTTMVAVQAALRDQRRTAGGTTSSSGLPLDQQPGRRGRRPDSVQVEEQAPARGVRASKHRVQLPPAETPAAWRRRAGPTEHNTSGFHVRKSQNCRADHASGSSNSRVRSMLDGAGVRRSRRTSSSGNAARELSGAGSRRRTARPCAPAAATSTTSRGRPKCSFACATATWPLWADRTCRRRGLITSTSTSSPTCTSSPRARRRLRIASSCSAPAACR